MIFHDFPWPWLFSMTFQAWKMVLLNSTTYQEECSPWLQYSREHLWHSSLLSSNHHCSDVVHWWTVWWFANVYAITIIITNSHFNLSFIINDNTNIIVTHKHTHTPFFRDHPHKPVPKEIFWNFMVQGKITEADTLTIWLGAAPSELISGPPPPSPIFMPDAFLSQPSHFILASAGTKYAGLHTRWHGLTSSSNSLWYHHYHYK